MKELNMEDFNVTDYITSTYKNASDYELQDALINLRHSMSESQIESKTLVSKHFDKFIECRAVIDSVYESVKTNRFLKKFDKGFTSKISQIDVTEYDIINQQHEVKKKLSQLFSLEEDLKSITSYEEFVHVNREAYKIKSEVSNSEFIDKKWKETDGARKEFLNKMVDEIESKDNNFEEMTHFFSMYFEIEKIRNVEDSERFKHEKIENTILVNLKYDMEKIFEENDLLGSIDECKFIIRRVFKYHFRREIKQEVVKSFSVHVLSRIEKQNEIVLRMVKKDINEIIEIISEFSDGSLKYDCIKILDEIEDKILEITIYAMIEDKSDKIDKWCGKFEDKMQKCIDMAGGRKAKKIKEAAVKVLNTRIEKEDLEEIKYIKDNFIDKGMKVLNENICDFQDVVSTLRGKEEKNLEEIIKGIEKDLKEIKIKSSEAKNKFEIEEFIVPETMMRILKIIDEFPLNYKKIIMRVSKYIDNKICLFYLKDICNTDQIKLIDEEKVIFERYKKAFGFLMKEKYDIFKDDKVMVEKDLRKLKIGEKENGEKKLRMDDKTI